MRLADRAKALLAAGEAAVVVRVAEVRGSAPREVGAAMIVSARGTFGSIGGGTLEWQAAAEGQRLLGSSVAGKGPHPPRLRSAPSPEGKGSDLRKTYTLGPDLGQCCGGQVMLEYLRLTADHPFTEGYSRRLYLFGAGHVGRALVLALAQTEIDVVWVDARPGAFPAAVPQNVSLVEGDERVLQDAPPGSMVLVMTHSHALDLAIVDAALRHAHVVETGLIGSATKRARFEHRLAAAGVAPEKIKALICPIGVGGIRSKKPEAIAISVAAQVLALDEGHAVADAPRQAMAS